MYFIFAWRYFNAKKSTNAINVISWVTCAGIAITVMCQLVGMSAFNGLEDLVKSLYSNFYTDIRISASSGKSISFTAEQAHDLKMLSGIKNFSLIVEEKALLQNGDLQTVVFLKGVDDNYAGVSGVPGKIVRGQFLTGTAENPSLVLGSGIENAIGVFADKNLSPLTVFLPKRSAVVDPDPLSALSEGNANTAGTFAIQQDFDDKYVITNLDFVKQQMNYRADEYTAVEVALTSPDKSISMQQSLRKILGPSYIVQTKYEQNTTLYNSMKMEKWAMYAILTLIQIVAAFNLIGALTMFVLEKRKDIGILQSFGARQSLILKIFLTEGIILAIIGAVAGFLLALILCYLQVKFKLLKIEGNSFLIDYFPVKLIAGDFLLVAITALIIALAGSWFPAYKASRQRLELKT